MNDKITVTMLNIETGQTRDFIGYWSWKEIYSMIKTYEKAKIWRIINIKVNV